LSAVAGCRDAAPAPLFSDPQKTGLNFRPIRWFRCFQEKKWRNRTPARSLLWRDVSKGEFSMIDALNGPESATAAVSAIAAEAGETSSDAILVNRIAAGDKLAMHALFARYRTSIYRWLLRFVASEALAEDLLSDVFLDVWRQADRFEGRSSVSTWLMSIARYKALSARRVRTEDELTQEIEAAIPDPSDDPEAALQEKDRGELLRQALTHLSREHREIIDLVYYHERSIAECAEIVGIPAATAKTRMFYARRKLAELVRDI
jgi:RNA polymerase sigma-70 factor, ECF subfamily